MKDCFYTDVVVGDEVVFLGIDTWDDSQTLLLGRIISINLEENLIDVQCFLNDIIFQVDSSLIYKCPKS